MTKKQLIKQIDVRIQNMDIKEVYHPRRLRPKWNSLTDDREKLALFEKYVSNKDVSIGLKKLVQVNLCEKTLEAVLIDYPEAVKYISIDDVLNICISKLSKYKNGREYLSNKGITQDG